MIHDYTLLHFLYLGIVNVAITLLGYILIKRQQVALSWLLLVGSVLLIYLIFKSEHPIIQMLAIIATTFTGMKVPAVTEGYKGKQLTLTFKQWAVFAAGWAGMRAQPFETLGAKPLPNAWRMIRFGISRLLIGGVLIVLAHYAISLRINIAIIYPSISFVLLIALSLILHFGLLSISAGSWRLRGVNVHYLFKQPAKALSLSEFWSKRWNMAFSEMTSVAIYRPLRAKVGAPAALMASFIFSGLLHELALSAPVNAGYGLPTLYFIIQGIMVLVEKALMNRKAVFLQNRFTARLWVFFWLAVPMPLLFHPHFIKEIVWPLVGLRA